MATRTKDQKDQLRGMDSGRLRQELVDTKKELFNLRFRNATGELENTARLGEARRALARTLTVAKQRGLDVERELRR